MSEVPTTMACWTGRALANVSTGPSRGDEIRFDLLDDAGENTGLASR